MPSGCDQMLAEDKIWSDLKTRTEYRNKMFDNRISYLWDHIIETFSAHLVDGTLLQEGVTGIPEVEQGLRIMAMESRFSRRVLGRTLSDLVARCPTGMRRVRRILPTDEPAKTLYLFLAASQDKMKEAEYRVLRREYLYAYCFVAASKHREFDVIVGIATEAATKKSLRSYDLALWKNQGVWTPEMESDAASVQERLKILLDENNMVFSFRDDEYARLPGRAMSHFGASR